MSQKADVDGVVEETPAAFGTLDILVNNAGATHINKPVVETSEAEYDRIFAVNVKGISSLVRRLSRRSASGAGASSLISDRPPDCVHAPGCRPITPPKAPSTS